MLRLFLAHFPEYTFLTEQRVADQRNAIYRRNLINDIRREAIKLEALREIGLRSGDSEREDADGTVEAHPLAEESSSHSDPGLATITDAGLRSMSDYERVNVEFEKSMLEFQGMDPEYRPLLPRLKYNQELVNITAVLDTLIEAKLGTSPSFEDIHTVVFCAAVTLTRHFNYKLIPKNRAESRRTVNVKNEPAWKRRLDMRIESLRVEIGRLTQWVRGNQSRRLRNKINFIMGKYHSHSGHGENNENVKDCLDTLTQKLAVLVARRNRYWKAYCRRKDNALFSRNEKSFYRQLEKQNCTTSGHRTPPVDEIENYWKAIWSQEETHESSAFWLKRFEQSAHSLREMCYFELDADEVRHAVTKTANWKSPGCDGIYSFYLKNFPSVHKHLARVYNRFLQSPDEMPLFLTKGVTHLLPKGEINDSPQDYRPITCLSVFYKLMTSILAKRIEAHCCEQGILAEHQRGCSKSSMGCKEQLTIDAVITGQANKGHRNLFSAYIDFKKAFDSVPHSWILKTIKTYKVSPVIIRWLQQTMGTWRTSIQMRNMERSAQATVISINRGIFQGDPLSPVLFCLAINPLSYLLESSGFGFQIRTEGAAVGCVSHLLYMDDIKLLAATQSQLQQMIDITADFSRTIKMQFGLEKCRTQSIIGGSQSVIRFNMSLGNLVPLEPKESYKYLGFHQANGTLHSKAKEELTSKFMQRVKQVLRSKLKSKFLVRAINSHAIPVLTYSFGIIKWTATDLDGLNRKLRVAFTSSGFHHPRASLERFNLPRNVGGRGVVDIKKLHDDQLKLLRSYFLGNCETSQLARAICRADDKLTPLDLAVRDPDEVTTDWTSRLIEQWKGKSLHGRFPAEVKSNHIDEVASFLWLQDGYLHPETEGLLLAIQDQVIATRNYQKFIIGDNDIQDDRCRLCQEKPETIQHITSACKILAPTDYKGRHDDVAKVIHGALSSLHGLGHSEVPYYKYYPDNVVSNDKMKLYWDRSIYTDRTVAHNRPDITLMNLEEGLGYLIDISIPNSHNVQEVYAEKLRKYQDLAFEMRHIYHLSNIITVPIIISSTGLIPHHLHTGLLQLGLKKDLIKILQRAVILGTCRIVRKFLNSE